MAKEKKGVPIADATKKAILQMDANLVPKKDIAKGLGISIATVYRVLKANDTAEQQAHRVEAMERIAGKMATRVEALVDGLDPGDASYMQRATVAGILTDKIAVLDRRMEEKEKAARETKTESLTIPATIEAMIGAIRNDFKTIDVKILRLVAGDRSVESLQVEAEKLENQIGAKLIEAEVTKVEDLDVGNIESHNGSGS